MSYHSQENSAITDQSGTRFDTGQRPMMSTVETEEATIIEVHTEEDRENDARLVEAYKNPPGDCSACFTGKTRPCGCGGRIHNEMHGRLVEMCFSCGTDWR